MIFLKLYRESQEKLGRWCRVRCYWNYQCSATLEAKGYGQITLLAKNKQADLKGKTIAEELRMSAALKIIPSGYDCQVVSTKYQTHIIKIC